LQDAPIRKPASENVTEVAVASLWATIVFAGAVMTMFWPTVFTNSYQTPLDVATAGRVKVTAPEAPVVVNSVPLSAAVQV
jgi:hypothetical protein